MDDIPLTVKIQAEAHAFRALVKHLQEHPEVQNMETMTAAGFCRNCLSKWLLAGFREQAPLPLENNLTYEEVSAHVYGMSPKEWKSAFQRKATQEELDRYESSKKHHATHPGDVLDPVIPRTTSASHSDIEKQKNPCCPESTEPVAGHAVTCLVPTKPMIPLRVKALNLKVGVLTVSDRVSAGIYQDESGPAIQSCLREFATQYSEQVNVRVSSEQVVPDDFELIAGVLRSWSDSGCCNLILTTGGTGFGTRDVTPEATASVVNRQLPSLSMEVILRTSQIEPLAFLSRGITGVTKEVVIFNLPGSPKGVKEQLSVGLPLLARAVAGLQGHGHA